MPTELKYNKVNVIKHHINKDYLGNIGFVRKIATAKDN